MMRYRRMGRTGLAVSEIGFGCGGNAGLMLRGTAAEQARIVARALELGVNYFDNAPDYGDGAAERNLGRALKAAGARPLLCSKVEIRRADLDDIAGHVVRSTEDSLRRLGVDALDVLQIHNAPWHEAPAMEGVYYARLGIDDYLRDGGVLDGLARLLRDGKVRHAGFVCRGDDVNVAQRLFQTGMFGMINVPYTLLNPTAGQAPPPGLNVARDGGGVLCHARGADVGAAIYSVLAGGFLSEDSAAGRPRHPVARTVDPAAEAVRLNMERARSLRFLAADTGGTLAQAAFRFVLSHPGVSTALGGFSAMEQLEEIAAASDAGPLPGSALAALERVWRTDFGLATALP
ncbi:aldo/keto reductase [Pigmentiphaga sp. YJ18]|uniref:aldo/keto reductase n=1 Tax=Pigmentiphaga sp. YJ18 TaxID=3134907 RepID=UPI00310F1980